MPPALRRCAGSAERPGGLRRHLPAPIVATARPPLRRAAAVPCPRVTDPRRSCLFQRRRRAHPPASPWRMAPHCLPCIPCSPFRLSRSFRHPAFSPFPPSMRRPEATAKAGGRMSAPDSLPRRKPRKAARRGCPPPPADSETSIRLQWDTSLGHKFPCGDPAPRREDSGEAPGRMPYPACRLETRWMVDAEQPSAAATTRTDCPERSLRMASSSPTADRARGRPPYLPSALAFSIPSRWRSKMMLRSNSAKAPRI